MIGAAIGGAIAGDIIGGALAGTGSIVGSLIGRKSGRDAQEAANKLNRELYYADREWNKPINQVARLREAGLNPNLIYDNGSGVVAGNTSKGAPRMESIGGYDVDFAGAINAALTYGALKKQAKEVDSISLSNENLKAQNDEINARRKGIELDNELKKHDLSVVKDTPTTSKDHGIGPQLIRGVNYVAKKVGEKANSNDFLRGASNLVIPQEMRGSSVKSSGAKVDKGVSKQTSNKPWFVRMQGKPWFIRHR